MKVEIKEDEHGEVYIELPRDLMEKLGWPEAIDCFCSVDDDGSIQLRKRNDPSYEA